MIITTMKINLSTQVTCSQMVPRPPVYHVVGRPTSPKIKVIIIIIIISIDLTTLWLVAQLASHLFLDIKFLVYFVYIYLYKQNRNKKQHFVRMHVCHCRYHSTVSTILLMQKCSNKYNYLLKVQILNKHDQQWGRLKKDLGGKNNINN